MKLTTLNQPQYKTLRTYTNYAKIYPKQIKIITFKNKRQVLEAGWEGQQPENNQTQSPKGQTPHALIDSLRRTKTKISDLTICNQFDSFATFTFAKNRQNVQLLKKQMSKWLKNQREKHGKFDYLIVPEFHKDGKSIHFHALMKNYQGQLQDSGLTKNKRKIYNITSYKLGFSTLVKIKDIEKVSSYIKKYITKDMPHFSGKKRYWCSNGLIRPVKQECNHLQDFSTMVKAFEKNDLTIYTLPNTIANRKLIKGVTNGTT